MGIRDRSTNGTTKWERGRTDKDKKEFTIIRTGVRRKIR